MFLIGCYIYVSELRFAFAVYRPGLIMSNGERHKTALSNMTIAHCNRLSKRSHPIYKSRERS